MWKYSDITSNRKHHSTSCLSFGTSFPMLSIFSFTACLRCAAASSQIKVLFEKRRLSFTHRRDAFEKLPGVNACSIWGQLPLAV